MFRLFPLIRAPFNFFLLVLLSACQASTNDSQDLVCVDCYKVPVSEVERAPSRVSELGAHRVDPGIRLEWKAAKDATEYEVYRMEWLATGSPKTKYTRLAATSELLFTDATVELWNEYSYTVVAVNKSGHAKPSEAARIKVFPYAGWVESWHRAPAKTAYSVRWLDIATEGGDYGLRTITEFPKDAGIENCTKTGAEVAFIRPAFGSYLGKSLQTISLTLRYNTGNEIWRYNLDASLHQGLFPVSAAANLFQVRPIFQDSQVIQGCGTAIVSFSADLRESDNAFHTYMGYLFVYFSVRDKNGVSKSDFGTSYRYYDGRSWIAWRSTSPEFGANLSKGELQVVFDYYSEFSQKVDVRLRHGTIENSGLVFGHAVTTIEGTGTVTLKIPYDSVCGESSAFLTMRSEDPYTTERGTRFIYNTVSNDAYEVVVVEPNRSRHHFARGEFGEQLWLRSCNGAEVVTLVAPHGWLAASNYVSETTAVTAPTGNFLIYPTEQAYESMIYGDYVTYVTARFLGATITAPVMFTVHDLFWQIGLPAKPVAGIPYPLVVTVAGPKPFSQVAWLNWRLETITDTSTIVFYRRPLLRWNDTIQAFVGETEFLTCGQGSMFILDPFYPLLQDFLVGAPTIETTATYKVFAKRSAGTYHEPADSFPHVTYLSGSDLGPRSVYLEEGCGKPFHWRVKAAPPWVRFEALSGTDQNPVRIAMLLDVAFENGKRWDVGAVELWIEESNQVFAFDVEAAY